jgi:hypothetical protein
MGARRAKSLSQLRYERSDEVSKDSALLRRNGIGASPVFLRQRLVRVSGLLAAACAGLEAV